MRSPQYFPEKLEEVESEIVRHAMPKEEAEAYRREMESGYSPAQRDRAHAPGPPIREESPAAIQTVSSSLNITYNADDLEVPAFMRKRGES